MATPVLDMPADMDMVLEATEDTDISDTVATTARGPLMPSPLPPLRLRLMLIPTTATTAMATVDTLATPPDTVTVFVAMPDTDTDTDTVTVLVATTVATTARGPLMLSPPLLLMPRLIPTTDTTAMDTVDTAPTDTA